MVDGDDIKLRKDGAEDRPVEKGFFPKVMDSPFAGDTNQGRVKITAMVGRNDAGTFFDHVLRADDAVMEESFGDGLAQRIAEPIPDGHSLLHHGAGQGKVAVGLSLRTGRVV